MPDVRRKSLPSTSETSSATRRDVGRIPSGVLPAIRLANQNRKRVPGETSIGQSVRSRPILKIRPDAFVSEKRGCMTTKPQSSILSKGTAEYQVKKKKG